MRFILASNVLEHGGFANFVRDAHQKYPDADFIVTGDWLNVFPEPGEDLLGSIFAEIYGDMIVSEMENLVANKFRSVNTSCFLEPLFDMFAPTGKHYERAKAMAAERYRSLFFQIEHVLAHSSRRPRFIFVPGNMDYPWISHRLMAQSNIFVQLDQEVMQIDDVTIAGIGGIPNNAHPFRGIVEISPYEMTEQEYARRLHLLKGADVLIAHLSPGESPALSAFLRESPVKLLICRAPFNFNREKDFRGTLELQVIEGKSVIMVRPFDYPKNHYYVVDLAKNVLNPPLIVQESYFPQPCLDA